MQRIFIRGVSGDKSKTGRGGRRMLQIEEFGGKATDSGGVTKIRSKRRNFNVERTKRFA